MDKFKIFSTFTGAGGLDIGFHGGFKYLGKTFPKLNFNTVTAIEYNKFACDSLKHNKKYFPNTKIIHEDITKTTPENYVGDYDVLLGGFPCVTFSMSGNRMGIEDDISGQLYQTYAKYVEVLKPKIFLAENVKGMLSANKGEAIKEVVRRFEDTGYKVQYQLVNFAKYGAPQLRERVIFIGIREDIDAEFLFPQYTHDKDSYVTAEEAFTEINCECENHIFVKQRDLTKEKIAAIPEGGNFKDLPDHLAIKATQSNIYRRLDRKKPAYTVLASGGGGTWTYHYEEPRALTNRERARLQGFPDDYIFQGSNTEVRRQIGNAVPAVGIYLIAKEIEKILKSI